jgi:transposase
VHVRADARGNPLNFRLTRGAAGDHPQALPLLDGVRAAEVLADRGDDADTTLTYSERARGAVATTPPKRHRCVRQLKNGSDDLLVSAWRPCWTGPQARWARTRCGHQTSV